MSDHDTEILDDAISTVYDRPDKHGEPENSFGTISDLWNAYLNATGRPITEKDAAVMLGLLKVARSTNGIYDEDNFVDLAGYAEMAARVAAPSDGADSASDDEQDDHPSDTTRSADDGVTAAD